MANMTAKKNLYLLATSFFLLHSGAALAGCPDEAASMIPGAVVEAAQISEWVGDKPTAEEVKVLGERVVDLNNAAAANKEKAVEAQKNLDAPGNCGDKLTQAQCIQKQIDFDTARMDIMSDDAKGKAKDEIAGLQVLLNAPKALSEASTNFMQASGVLQEMIQTKDFSYKEHFGIIGKALLSSWKELITPGPIVAVASGMAGYGIARATPLNTNANELFIQHPAPSTASKISDQVGYAYPVLAPFLIVAAITKNNNTMKTFDALAVGTAISEAIVEPLKYTVKECRPNGADCLGFPSAHAAQTFMMATVLDHEYPGHHHIVGALAYAGAATVSFFRVWERNHTPGEIFAGAGIGVATGIAASRSVDNEFDAAEGKKRSYWKDAAVGNFRVPKTGKVVHCVPMGLAGSCEMTW